MDRRKLRRLKTLDRIRKAVAKAVSENGYKGATSKIISKMAGISEALLFKYYKDKEDLVKSVYVDIAEEFYEYLQKRMKGNTFERRLKSFVDAFIDFAFSNPDEFKFIVLMHEYYGHEPLRNREFPLKLLKDISDMVPSSRYVFPKKYVIVIWVNILVGMLEFYFRGELSSTKPKMKEIVYKAMLKFV